MTTKYQAIQMDINNTCNIRCRFCVNDWATIKPKINMTEDLFQKTLVLLPLISRAFMSCSFEPLDSPDFFKFFKQIPKGDCYKFITTNLARYMTVQELRTLSTLPLDAINVSISSVNKSTYEELHRGADYFDFMYNLTKLREFINANGSQIELKFITVVLKQNIKELEKLAAVICHDFGASMHQFRTPFVGEKKNSWLQKSLPSEKDWKDISKKLSLLPYNIKLFDPLYGNSMFGTNPIKDGKRPTNTYFTLYPDGEVTFHEKDRKRLPTFFRESFNITELGKPELYDLFAYGLEEINKLEEK